MFGKLHSEFLFWLLRYRGIFSNVQFYTFLEFKWISNKVLYILAKKISFYFLQNVWKSTVFAHLHSKLTKVLIWPKKLSCCKKFLMGIKKRWFQIRWCSKKVMSKKPWQNLSKLKTQNSDICCLYIFMSLFQSRHQQIWNHQKILLFWYPYCFFMKHFLSHNNTFCKLRMKC